MTHMIKSFFTLRKPKKTFRQIHSLYLKKSATLDASAKERVQKFIQELREAILKKDAKKAKTIAKELEKQTSTLFPKSTFEKIRDFVTGMGVVLLVAVLILTMWFYFYT